jgi:hypothetical protein
MFADLTRPENVYKNSEILYTCCKRPQVSALAETKSNLNDEGRWATVPWVNKICLSCYSHWHGDPANPKFYTKKEWDEWIMGMEL